MGGRPDPTRAQVEFAVKHRYDDRPRPHRQRPRRRGGRADHLEATSPDATVGVASRNTHDARRDNDRRRSISLERDKYPTITFRGVKPEPSGPERYALKDAATIKGVPARSPCGSSATARGATRGWATASPAARQASSIAGTSGCVSTSGPMGALTEQEA